MQISRDHKLIRYAYSLPDSVFPSSTTLCRLFWRLVFLSFFYLLCLALAISLLTALAMVTMPYPGLLYFFIGVPIVGCYLVKWTLEFLEQDPRAVRHYIAETILEYEPTALMAILGRIERSLFWQVVKSIKTKVCPIIELR